MSGEIRWSNLSVCGIPITADPDHQVGDALVARDGDMLIVSLQVDDEGIVVGATGHIEKKEDGPGIFRCASCAAVVYSFDPDRGPSPDWTWDAEADKWYCGMCSEERSAA